ncbi:MAG TPA: diguanylate cyclase [Gemmatimonadales bacterium]|nr:diguanylate cyclase [Gemmatimonadales bacterium]
MTAWLEIIARRLHVLRLDSIRSKILVFAVLATLVPTLAATIVSYGQQKRLLTDRLVDELRSTSSEAARGMDQWLEERLADLRVAVSSYAVPENLTRIQGNGGSQALGRLRDYLTSVRQRSTDCEAVLLMDARGRAVTSSAGRLGSVLLPLDRLNGLRTGDALVGDAYWDGALAKPVVMLAVPIRQPDGRYLGALAAKLNLRSAADLLQRLAPDAGGDVSLMTEQGRMVLRSGASSADLMRTKLPPRATEALLDGEGATVVYKRGDGQELVATLRRVPRLHWAAVAEMPQAEIAHQVARLRGVTALTIAALLLGVGLVAYVLALLIVRPLAELTGAAAKLAAGDLSVDLPASYRGEVGALTQAFRHLAVRLREREGQGELERLSVTDALTGLYNRRHLMGTLANEVQRSRRLRRTFSVLLADVDHFKQYNDTYGHLAGDAALVKIAEILRKTTRGVDSVARYGGEEFVVMLLETTLATAVTVADRIRARVAAEQFGAGKMTVSIGVAEYPAHGDTPEELIASADAAMYQAKGEGRDRVVSAGGPPEVEKEGRRRRKGRG